MTIKVGETVEEINWALDILISTTSRMTGKLVGIQEPISVSDKTHIYCDLVTIKTLIETLIDEIQSIETESEKEWKQKTKTNHSSSAL